MSEWATLYGNARQELIRKMQFGTVLVKDYDPAGDLSTFTPFDTDGTFADLTSAELTDVGPLTADGVEYSPSVSGSDTTIWQSRQVARHDVTEDTETAAFSPSGTSPTTIALYRNLLLSAVPAISASAGLRVTRPNIGTIFRTVLFLAVDGAGDQAVNAAVLYPKCSVTDKDKSDWKADTEVLRPLTLTPYRDPKVGSDIAEYWDGPGWRALA